jgi:hypothetical protein
MQALADRGVTVAVLALAILQRRLEFQLSNVVHNINHSIGFYCVNYWSAHCVRFGESAREVGEDPGV